MRGLRLAGELSLGLDELDGVVRFAYVDVGLSTLFDLPKRPATKLTVPPRVTFLTVSELPADA